MARSMGLSPVVSTPSDGDAANAASVAQAFKDLADNVDLLNRGDIVFLERWQYGSAAVPGSSALGTVAFPWDTYFSAVPSITSPTASYPCAFYQSSDSLTSNGITRWPMGQTPPLTTATMGMALEFDAAVSATGATISAQFGLCNVGMQTNNDPTTTTTDCAYFEFAAGGTQWTARTRTASTSTVVSATPVNVITGTAPAQSFRIEVYGSTAYGGSQTVVFKASTSIGGAFTTIGNSTTNLSTSAMAPLFHFRTSGGTNCKMSVGRVRLTVW